MGSANSRLHTATYQPLFLENLKEYVKKITIIWGCVLGFLCGIITHIKSSSILINLEGIYNLFNYLLDALIPSLIITGIICMVILTLRLIFFFMTLVFGLINEPKEDESFVYTVDTKDTKDIKD